MKLDQLQYFVEAARRQHVGQAARFLHISPSAISHSIASLEEELGKPLFAKQGRQVRLTQAGKLLLERAEAILTEVNRLREDLSEGQLAMRGHYRIAANPSLCADFLTPAWMGLQAEHPGLTATLYSLRSAEVLSRVSAGEVDLGFCFSPQSSPQHDEELLHQGNMVMCFGKRHPFLKHRRIEQLSDVPSFMPVESQGIESCGNLPAFRRLGITVKVSNYFDSFEVAASALKLNTCWALLPDFIVQANRSELEAYVPRGWDARYKVSAVWPRYRVRTRALDLVVERLGDRLRSLESIRSSERYPSKSVTA